MIVSELKVLSAVLHGKKEFNEIITETKLAKATVSEALTSLDKKNLIEKKRTGLKISVELSRNSLNIFLKQLNAKMSLIKLLANSREKVLIELIEPISIEKIAKKTDLSIPEIYNCLRSFQELGVIKKKKNTYYATEEIKDFVSALKEFNLQARAEPNARIVFSGKEVLKILPKNSKVNGSKTAFSVFYQYGIDYFTIDDYFVESEKKPSIEEVLIHALVFSENKKDNTICIIFYLKNKNLFDKHKLIKTAKKYSVQNKLLDIFAFLDGRETKKTELFMPFKEFKEKASVYNVKPVNKFKETKIEELFEFIGSLLGTKTKAYLIGGANLILRKIKSSTKDIDIIIETEKDFIKIKKALKKKGFKSKKPFSEYEKMNPSAVLEKEGFPRIDIFTKTVCNALSLPKKSDEKGIKKEFGNLELFLLPLEDIILFKAITERDADIEDIQDIIRKENINWNNILSELIEQEKYSERLFCLDILDSFELLEERHNIIIPLKNQLLKHCLEHGIHYLLKQEPLTVKQIMQKINFSETKIRNSLKKLEKLKKVEMIKGNPMKFKNA